MSSPSASSARYRSCDRRLCRWPAIFLSRSRRPLLPGPGLRDGFAGRAQLADHGGDLIRAQPVGLRGDPRRQGGRPLAAQRRPRPPQLLLDVAPVQARLRLREEALRTAPDRVRPVGQEDRPLAPVAPLLRLGEQPHEERLVPVEGRVHALVHRPLPAVLGALQRVDHPHDHHAGVLGLLARLAARARMESAVAPPGLAGAALAALGLAPGRAPTRGLLGRDHRRPAAVDLDHEDLAVAFGTRPRRQEGSRGAGHASSGGAGPRDATEACGEGGGVRPSDLPGGLGPSVWRGSTRRATRTTTG